MASVDLLFSQAPATGHPVNLVFGSDAAPDVALAALAGALPPPVLTATLSGWTITPGALAGALPGTALTADLRAGTVTPVTLAGTMQAPALQANIRIRQITGAVLAGALPAPALQADVRVGGVDWATLVAALPPVAGLQGDVRVGGVDWASVSGALPPAVLQAEFIVFSPVVGTFSAALPPAQLIAGIDAQYLSNTDRPTVGQTGAMWQVAAHGETGTALGMQSASAAPAGTTTQWQAAQRVQSMATAEQQQAQRQANSASARHQEGEGIRAQAKSLHADALRSMRAMLAAAHQEAAKAQTAATRQRHQDGIRTRTDAIAAPWQEAVRNLIAGLGQASGPAVWLNKYWDEDHQEAMRPPAGMYVRPVVVPPRETCYTPGGDLLFWQAPGSTLVFICEKHGITPPAPVTTVVVPIQRTYVTINSISLRRVDGDVAIPTYAFQMSLDVDSWTWSWSASVPLDALVLVQPGSSGEPVEVEALVNGVPYRLYAEGIASQRQFGQARISVKGRGKAALLDAPYAPVMNFGNAADRTAQQLMTDVLTVNGVGIGWAVDFNLADWLVPGNTWTAQGAYISAITAIAQAAGGYVQPHDTAQTLRILPRYPAAPWAWSDITPDFELPAAVVAVEGIEWTRKADYNRVFVSGVNSGVLGQVTRAGTAGDSVAPMVTDSLITHADAARQRGLAILSDTGHQARVTLTLPVLAETGLIKPGQFVRYLDGSQARLGLVRSTSLAWSRPKLRQTIAVETHV